ncbi:hypothetical protein [Longimicrobium sp.]|uniref:hypothetical protein n=1 Tax=Longimicrobium sp. TaxID=2029185 RepID=UPI002D1A9194|nr:hypothetical protein [Longimicrobium sp.]HSU17486.1 hypothetical protein [Longimicrobium sp.]
MKIQDVRTAAERRTFANAVTVIVVLALVSLTLEWRSGSDFGEIASSFASFGIILSVAAFRFFVRSSDPTSGEKLWITALWNAAIDLVGRLLPGGAAAPPSPAPAPASAPQRSSSSTVTLPGRSTGDDGVRRDTYD